MRRSRLASRTEPSVRIDQTSLDFIREYRATGSNSARSAVGIDKSCTASESMSRKKRRNGSIRAFSSWNRGVVARPSGTHDRERDRLGSSSRRFRSLRILRKSVQTSVSARNKLAPLARAVNFVNHSPGEQFAQIHADIAARDAEPAAQVIGRPVGSRDVEQGEQLTHGGVDSPGPRHQAPVLDKLLDQLLGGGRRLGHWKAGVHSGNCLFKVKVGSITANYAEMVLKNADQGFRAQNHAMNFP